MWNILENIFKSSVNTCICQNLHSQNRQVDMCEASKLSRAFSWNADRVTWPLDEWLGVGEGRRERERKRKLVYRSVGRDQICWWTAERRGSCIQMLIQTQYFIKWATRQCIIMATALFQARQIPRKDKIRRKRHNSCLRQGGRPSQCEMLIFTINFQFFFQIHSFTRLKWL